MSLFGDIAGLAAINTAYNKLGSIGETAQSDAEKLAEQLETKSRFRPFSVTTSTGGANLMADGNLAVSQSRSRVTNC